MRTIPDHVPPELVRDVGLDFRGPMDELFPRLDALRAEGRALWIETPYGTGAWLKRNSRKASSAVTVGAIAASSR